MIKSKVLSLTTGGALALLFAAASPALAAQPACPAFGPAAFPYLVAARAVARPSVGGPVLSFSELPAYNGSRHRSILIGSYASQIGRWDRLGQAIERGDTVAVDAAARESIAATDGPAQVQDIVLTDNDAHDPSIPPTSMLRLALLPSGQPVLALPLVIGRADAHARRFGLGSGQRRVLVRAVVASLLGPGGRFYGVQRMSPNLAVALIELPEAGRFLHSDQYVRYSRLLFMEILDVIRRLVRAGYGVDDSVMNLRPYATASGHLALLPVPSLATYGPESGALKRVPYQETLNSLRLRISDANEVALAEQATAAAVEAGMLPYLLDFAERGLESNQLIEALRDAGGFDLRRVEAELQARWQRVRGETPASRAAERSQIHRLGVIQTVLETLSSRETQGPLAVDIGAGDSASLAPLVMGQMVAIHADPARRIPTTLRGFSVPEIAQVEQIKRDRESGGGGFVVFRAAWRHGVGRLSPYQQRPLVVDFEELKALSIVVLQPSVQNQITAHLSGVQLGLPGFFDIPLRSEQ